jgi:RES domain-containing protein
MLVYRVTHAKYKDQTLSGLGAEKVGGRWNEIGTRAVYCSENISLALLEYYIHAQNIGYLPKSILVAQIEIPDALKIDILSELPEAWNQYPYSSKTAKLFTQHAKNSNFFGLKVPSSIVGLEHNFILNPMHKDFDLVSIKNFFELPIDPRLKA